MLFSLIVLSNLIACPGCGQKVSHVSKLCNLKPQMQDQPVVCKLDIVLYLLGHGGVSNLVHPQHSTSVHSCCMVDVHTYVSLAMCAVHRSPRDTEYHAMFLLIALEVLSWPCVASVCGRSVGFRVEKVTRAKSGYLISCLPLYLVSCSDML